MPFFFRCYRNSVLEKVCFFHVSSYCSNTLNCRLSLFVLSVFWQDFTHIDSVKNTVSYQKQTTVWLLSVRLGWCFLVYITLLPMGQGFCQNMHDCTMYTLFKLFRHQLLYSKIPYPKRLNCTQVDNRPGTISRDGFGFWWHEWSAPADRQVISTTLAVPQRELWPQFCLWRCQQITRTKAYWQSVSLYCATNIIKPTCFGICQKNYFLFRGAPKKCSIPPTTLIMLRSNHYGNNISINLVRQFYCLQCMILLMTVSSSIWIICYSHVETRFSLSYSVS